MSQPKLVLKKHRFITEKRLYILSGIVFAVLIGMEIFMIASWAPVIATGTQLKEASFSVEGTVENTHAHNSGLWWMLMDGYRSNYKVTSVSYTVNNKVYSIDNMLLTPHLNQKVQVYYDAQNPANAVGSDMLSTAKHLQTLNVFTLIPCFAVAILALFVFIQWAHRRSKVPTNRR